MQMKKEPHINITNIGCVKIKYNYLHEQCEDCT